MLARGDDDAEPRAGVDVDVRIDAALADEAQLGQALEQWHADLGALADQHQGLAVAEPPGECVHLLDVVIPDRDVVVPQLLEAAERTDGVEIVVENRNLHAGYCAARLWVKALPPASSAARPRALSRTRDRSVRRPLPVSNSIRPSLIASSQAQVVGQVLRQACFASA